ncbi:MAG TPA: prolyl oligopeptidase family serine peptidase, partial [Holophagaceae bacterium]|nr:prolyl oligopeptidase family serine peptidase [Holophagaceae bacterium]
KQALTQGPLAAWTAISAREGVLVAALDGVKGPDGHSGWNDCRGDASGNPKTDDVAFVKAVVERLIQESHADPKRVYIMGMSNGAMMTLRLALQLDPAPAAFCAVCGLMSEGAPCGGAARPIPALLIDGTEDPLVPFNGGQVHFYRKMRGGVVSADQTVAFWRAAEGLGRTPAVASEFPHLDPSDPTRALKSVWGSSGGAQVEFIRVAGGGHAEPTLGHPYGALYRAFTGKQNRDFESAEEAWAFFKDKRSR